MNSATTTAEKPAPAPSETESSLRLFNAVDQALLAAAREGRTQFVQLTGAEILLCQRLGWDKDQTRREIARRAQIVLTQAKAGTQAERDAAQKRLDAANEKLATEGSQLRDELAKITTEINAKIAKLESKATEAQKVVTAYTQAVLKLRYVAPEHIKHDMRLAGDRAKAEYQRRLSELFAKIETVRNLERIDPRSLGDQASAIRYAIEHAPELLRPTTERTNHRREINVALWDQHVRQLQDQVPKLRNEYAVLKANESQAVRDAEAEALSYYVPS